MCMAQVTSWNLVDTVFCCGNDTWFDIDEDGENEVWIQVTILTDVGAVKALGMNGTLISPAMPYGSEFEDFEYSRYLTVGGVGCLWPPGFAPGEPSRYIAVLEDTGPDTLWRYIRASMFYLDPTPGNFCKTGIAIEEAVYQAMPNTPLFAGEGSTSSTSGNNISSLPILYPNPTTGTLYIGPEFRIDRVTIMSLTGEIFLDEQLSSNMLDLSAVPSGLYLLVMYSDRKIYSQKVVRQ